MVLYSETLKVHSIQEHRNSGTISSIQVTFFYLQEHLHHIDILEHGSCGDVQENSETLRILEITFKFRNMSH